MPAHDSDLRNRLFILAESRSGSNWLTETLNNHEDLLVLREIFHPGFRKSMVEKMDSNDLLKIGKDIDYFEQALLGKGAQISGCKILFSQLIRVMDFYRFLEFYKNQYMIVLTRENIIHAELSGEIARLKQNWHLMEGEPILSPVNLDVKVFFKRLEWRRMRKAFVTEALNLFDIDYLEIGYSDLFEHRNENLGKIFGFLGVDYQFENLKLSKEKKSNPYTLKEMVVNYEELEDFLRPFPEYFKYLTGE